MAVHDGVLLGLLASATARFNDHGLVSESEVLGVQQYLFGLHTKTQSPLGFPAVCRFWHGDSEIEARAMPETLIGLTSPKALKSARTRCSMGGRA